MVGPLRYQVNDKSAGIEKGVLKNKLGLKKQKQLENAETLLLADAYDHFFELSSERKIKFDFDLLIAIHKYFFCVLYDWAGKIRTVNISKGEMMFAPAEYLNVVLDDFKKLLKMNLLKVGDDKNEIAKKLAILHNEFNVIHPFREGNG